MGTQTKVAPGYAPAVPVARLPIPAGLGSSDNQSWIDMLKDFSPEEGWGSRAQVGGAYQDLQDMQGNRDGLWSNEGGPAGSTGSWLESQPMYQRAAAFAGVGLSPDDETAALDAFRVNKEAKWGRPTTDLPLDQLKDGKLFAAEKAIALDRMGRTPAEITEGFIDAKGSVDGKTIAPRKVFWQRFKPTARATGRVIVISPGFTETGRNFYDQAQAMNKLGHDVLLMDHQWAGQTKGGAAGAIDSGEGVARDVAAMAAFAQRLADKDYGQVPNHGVTLFGNSMGAGPGVLGALTYNDNGKVALEGDPMPKGLDAVLQAPFLGATNSVKNHALETLGKVPWLNDVAFPAMGGLTRDSFAAQLGAQGTVQDDARSKASAMNAANPAIARIHQLIAEGKGPQGRLSIVHGQDDILADPANSMWLDQVMGDRASLKLLPTSNHVLEQSPTQQLPAIEALQQLEAQRSPTIH